MNGSKGGAGFANPEGVLPGLRDVDARFDGRAPAPRHTPPGARAGGVRNSSLRRSCGLCADRAVCALTAAFGQDIHPRVLGPLGEQRARPGGLPAHAAHDARLRAQGPLRLVQSQPSSRKWLCSLMAPTCMQVEFNAGVVAAGEARIESTVVGNTPAARARSARDALRNQTQVYLPVINSADR
jgi:hypothetical protein